MRDFEGGCNLGFIPFRVYFDNPCIIEGAFEEPTDEMSSGRRGRKAEQASGPQRSDSRERARTWVVLIEQPCQ